MKKLENIRLYAWVEFVIWLVIVAISVFCIRYNYYKSQSQYKSYQIFMEDADGLIVGSPVKFLGTQIGYVKKIQIISSEVYIKFVITQKGLNLPLGSIATVEFSGLGGSKALEIYPPDKNNPTDKIIVIKEPTRLNKVVGLFDSIFKELDSIITTVEHSANQFEFTRSGKVSDEILEPVEIEQGLDRIDSSVDKLLETEKRLKTSLKKIDK